ncbi:MAG TPA: ECF-type sigma factor [Blastocatellia bacterium]|nr:ECF-type sigma factor [Blastocatellia bacterium]
MITPSSQSPGDVTQLLLKWRNGDKTALEDLMRLVNYELRRLARACLRREYAERTMQTADLVNEAFLRLIKGDQVDWRDRAHFFAVAAEVMRRVLVEEARKRKRLKRGGSRTRVDLEQALTVTVERGVELLALDEALDWLSQFDPRKCRIVELRFFGGLTIEETATVLDVSVDAVRDGRREAAV